MNKNLWPSNTEDIQNQSDDQRGDIVSKISGELDLFEKAFFDLLTMLVEQFEKAKLYDNVMDTSQIRDRKQPIHLLNAENALSQLFYIFHTVVNAHILCFMKLIERGAVDEQLQSNGFLLIISKLANMRKAVRQALNSIHGGRFNTLFYDNIYDEKMIQRHADVFKDAGIIEAVEPLLHSVSQIYNKVELGS